MSAAVGTLNERSPFWRYAAISVHGLARVGHGTKDSWNSHHCGTSNENSYDHWHSCDIIRCFYYTQVEWINILTSQYWVMPTTLCPQCGRCMDVRVYLSRRSWRKLNFETDLVTFTGHPSSSCAKRWSSLLLRNSSKMISHIWSFERPVSFPTI